MGHWTVNSQQSTVISPIPISPFNDKTTHTLDLLQKCFLQDMEKGVHVKGERENTKLFPLSPYPFPDLCKKSIPCLSVVIVDCWINSSKSNLDSREVDFGLHWVGIHCFVTRLPTRWANFIWVRLNVLNSLQCPQGFINATTKS